MKYLRKINESNDCPVCGGVGVTSQVMCQFCNGTGNKEVYDFNDKIDEIKKGLSNDLLNLFKKYNISHGYIDVETNLYSDNYDDIESMILKSDIYAMSELNSDFFEEVKNRYYDYSIYVTHHPTCNVSIELVKPI